MAKLSPEGDTIEYATFIGGSGDDMDEAVFVSSDGSATGAGSAESTDLSVGETAFSSEHSGNIDAFAATVSADCSAATCTCLGVAQRDAGRGGAIRSRKGLVTRIPSKRRPTTRSSSASRYTVMSGSSSTSWV